MACLGSIPGLGRSSGEGNGNPLRYSCLEYPMDREDHQATVRGVAKSRTRLSDYHYATATMACLRKTTWPGAAVEDCAILELFVWQMAQHLVCCLPAQKFTFGEAGITDRSDIFICWYDRRYSISHHPWNDYKEVKLTHPPMWGLPF